MKLKHKNFLNKIVALTAALLLNLAFVPISYAGSLSAISDTMTRLKNSSGGSVYSDHTILFTTPTGIANGNTVTLTFPGSSFTMNASLSGVTIADNGGADNAVTSASWSTPTLTITASSSSTVAAGHTATIKLPGTTNQIANPTTSNTYVVSIAGTFGDTGKFAVVIVDNDQIPVTATVNPIISMTIDNTTLALGTISTSSPTYPATNNIITIGTNAHNGYTITVKDIGNSSNPGLYSSTAAALIASAGGTTDLSSTNGYGGQCHKDSGSGSCNFSLDSGNSVTGVTLAGVTFASYGSKPSGTDQFKIRVGSRISTSQEAATDYQDTLTIIGTANF